MADFAQRPQLADRLRKFVRARLHLVEQPHVLDRDHRLIGEGGDQLDLLVRERPYGASYERDDADRISFTQQGNSKDGPKTKRLLHVQIRVFRVRQHVGHMNGLCCRHRSSDDASSPAFVWDGLDILNDVRRVAVDRDQIVSIALLTRDGGHIRFAKVGRQFGQRIEHRLQIEGRAADDLEHVGGGGLLLQRFAQLVEQSRIFDGDDGLIGKIRDQLDLLVGERPHLLAVDAEGTDQRFFLEHRHDKKGPCARDIGNGNGRRIAFR